MKVKNKGLERPIKIGDLVLWGEDESVAIVAYDCNSENPVLVLNISDMESFGSYPDIHALNKDVEWVKPFRKKDDITLII